MKSPLGGSKKNTIAGQLTRAKAQSRYVIIDVNRASLRDDFVIEEVRRLLSTNRYRLSVEVVRVVTKEGGVVDIASKRR
jgi:hypothetical protein